MVKYIQKVGSKSSFKMVQFLTQIEENWLKMIENNIVKREVFFWVILKWLQNLKNFGKIKVDNKYVWKWLVKLNLNILLHYNFDVFNYDI
jgi:hypothetical protein